MLSSGVTAESTIALIVANTVIYPLTTDRQAVIYGSRCDKTCLCGFRQSRLKSVSSTTETGTEGQAGLLLCCRQSP